MPHIVCVLQGRDCIIRMLKAFVLLGEVDEEGRYELGIVKRVHIKSSLAAVRK